MMGKLRRHTRSEIEAVECLPELLGEVAERGPIAVKEFAVARGWSEGELWRWLHENDGRWAVYVDAKRYHSEMKVGEVMAIADGSGEAKLRVDTRFRVAEKWYPEVYGPRLKVEREAPLIDDGELLAGMVELLRLAAAGGLRKPERTVEGETMPLAPASDEQVRKI